MPRPIKIALVAGAAGLFYAARRAAYAPPDPVVKACAEVAAYSGPWTHGYKIVNGVKLHYAEMGNQGAPLLILLHGFPECWYEWRDIMPALAGRFHVVAPDMRGYNWSERPRGVKHYAVDIVCKDIVGLIDAFGQERAHIVGHDWGGAVAWYFGAAHGDRLDKLVVLNAPYSLALQREILHSTQLLRSLYIFWFQLPLFAEATSRLLGRWSLRATAVVPGAFSDAALDVYEHAMSQPGAATAMLNYYRAFARSALRLRKTDPTIKRPTLLIWGMQDFALLPGLADNLDQWIPDLQVERVEDCGHWVPEEKPRLVADSILRFL